MFPIYRSWTLEGREEQMTEFHQKVCGIRMEDCAFNAHSLPKLQNPLKSFPMTMVAL